MTWVVVKRVVLMNYPIQVYKHTIIYKLIDAEHNKLLKQGISIFSDLPKKSRNICANNNSNKSNTCKIYRHHILE